MTTDYAAPWFHGSPFELTILRKGSWITQFREVAKAFAHKPKIISMSDDCQSVKHNGTVPAFLYTIAEPIGPDDVSLLPETALTHWQTQRDLSVQLVRKLPVSDPPFLTETDMEGLRRLRPEVGTGTGFYSIADEGGGAEQGNQAEHP